MRAALRDNLVDGETLLSMTTADLGEVLFGIEPALAPASSADDGSAAASADNDAPAPAFLSCTNTDAGRTLVKRFVTLRRLALAVKRSTSGAAAAWTVPPTTPRPRPTSLPG